MVAIFIFFHFLKIVDRFINIVCSFCYYSQLSRMLPELRKSLGLKHRLNDTQKSTAWWNKSHSSTGHRDWWLKFTFNSDQCIYVYYLKLFSVWHHSMDFLLLFGLHRWIHVTSPLVFPIQFKIISILHSSCVAITVCSLEFWKLTLHKLLNI